MIALAKRAITALGLRPVALRIMFAATRLIAIFKRLHIVKWNGIRYRVDLNEVIDSSIFAVGHWEASTCEFLRTELRPGSVVLEVGANIGAHTLLMAKLSHPGRVFAFEPTDYACSKLRQNLSLNPDISNVTIVQAMVSDHYHSLPKTRIKARWPTIGPQLAREAVGQSCISLDEFAESKKLTRVSLLKIDVDGYDYRVLCGATRLLSEFKPAVLIELANESLSEIGDSVAGIHALLKSSGYQFVKMFGENGLFRPAPHNSSTQNPVPMI